MHHGQRETRSHGGIDSIAAVFQNFNASVGCQVMDADYHGVSGMDWLFLSSGCNGVFCVVGSGILGVERREAAEAGNCGKSSSSYHKSEV
jgi:hypothetical protein